MKKLEAAIKGAGEKNRCVSVKSKEVIILVGVSGKVVRYKSGKYGYIPPDNSTLVYLGTLKHYGDYHDHRRVLIEKYYHLAMGKIEVFIKFEGAFARIIRKEDIPESVIENFVSSTLMKLRKFIYSFYTKPDT